MDIEYTNSKIECAICGKKLAKNYMLTHLKTTHKNCYGTDWWDKYSDKYEKIKRDNKNTFGIK